MKKPTSKKPLALQLQTVRTLADDVLLAAAGGLKANNTFTINCHTTAKTDCTY